MKSKYADSILFILRDEAEHIILHNYINNF